MKALEIQDVWRSRDEGLPALRGVNLLVEPGEIVGLLGTYDAGKTTLVRIAMGLLWPDQGRVRVLGLDPSRQALRIRSLVGYVPKELVLPWHLRVAEALALHQGLFLTWDDEFARHLCQRLDLDEGQPLSEFNKEQARQLALVCAVAHRPELLILDEPSTGLEPEVRRKQLEVARTLLAEEGSAILISSYQVEDVESLVDRVAWIEEGRIFDRRQQVEEPE